MGYKKTIINIILIILTLALIFSIIHFSISFKEIHEKVNDFCEENSYDSASDDNKFCIKQEGKFLIKSEIERCGDSWCFVEER